MRTKAGKEDRVPPNELNHDDNQHGTLYYGEQIQGHNHSRNSGISKGTVGEPHARVHIINHAVLFEAYLMTANLRCNARTYDGDADASLQTLPYDISMNRTNHIKIMKNFLKMNLGLDNDREEYVKLQTVDCPSYLREGTPECMDSIHGMQLDCTFGERRGSTHQQTSLLYEIDIERSLECPFGEPRGSTHGSRPRS